MDSDTKKLIRSVVRRVHPDLFTGHAFERQCNSDSLKALNSYVEQLARGSSPPSTTLEFWVKDGEQRMARIQALLPASGSLGPLFYAFGLITEEELRSGTGGREDVSDVNFLQWLQATVNDALRIAQEHESLKLRIREARASVEQEFGLASLQVGSEFAIGPLEQQRQLQALQVLEAGLTAVRAEAGRDFSGLIIQVHHPDSRPPPSSSAHARPSSTHVAEDGVVHILADKAQLGWSLRSLDLNRARVLTKVSVFWHRRVRDLTPVLKALLHVDNVWCDTRTEQNSQNFVLWAGYVLEQRDEIAAAIGSRSFAFSLLVHSDSTSPLVDFSRNSSILQIRSDATPKMLVEFLVSESGSEAAQAAAAVQIAKKEEQQLLEAIRTTFGAKHVVRVASTYESERVMEGARRLLANADAIRATVDLRGASLALDDCYEVWGSGFISIPYDFKLSELQPQLIKLLGAGTAAANGAGSNGNGTTSHMGAGDAASSRRQPSAVAAARVALQHEGGGMGISRARRRHGWLCEEVQRVALVPRRQPVLPRSAAAGTAVLRPCGAALVRHLPNFQQH